MSLQDAIQEYDQAVKEWGRVANRVLDWYETDNDPQSPINQDLE